MFERILAMDSWKTFCLPFLSKCYWPGFLLVENSVQYHLLTLKIHKLIVQYTLKKKLNFIFFSFWWINLGQIYFKLFGSTKKYDIRYMLLFVHLRAKLANYGDFVFSTSLEFTPEGYKTNQLSICWYLLYVPLASVSGVVWML